MSAAEPRKRRAWVAGLLNATNLGLGFLYLGKPYWAFATLLAMLALTGAFGWSRLVLFPAGFFALLLAMLCVWAGSIVVAVLAARRLAPATLAPFQRWYVYLGYFVLSILTFKGLMESRSVIFGYEPFRFHSASMERTLVPGDYFMSNTWKFRSRGPERGELVIFIHPGDRSLKYVMRVIGLPGEIVRIQGRQVRVNGSVLSEPYLDPANNQGLSSPGAGEFRIPDASYFVLGDNRDNSSDSRAWGFVPRQNLLGSVEYIWYSRDADRIGLKVR
jgi:signal peptidase I